MAEYCLRSLRRNAGEDTGVTWVASLRNPGHNPVMQGFWEQLQLLVSSGRPFVTVTLVDVVASAPANVGSKMLVTPDGLFHGSVGGGKIEMKAIAEAKAM